MLFDRNQDIHKNAYPNWQKLGREYDQYFVVYADHFKEAGDNLIFSIGDNQGHVADSIINPALYLYRHSLELLLKAILFKNYVHDGNNIEKIKEKLKGHSLESLWNKTLNEIKNNYSLFNSNEDKNEFKKIGKLIVELHNTDNGSMNYRYPYDKDLQEFIYGDGKESYGIDFIHLQKEINYLYNRLYYWIYYNIAERDKENM